MEKRTLTEGLPEKGDALLRISHGITMDKTYGDYTSHRVDVSVELPVSREVIANLCQGSVDGLATIVHQYVVDSTNNVLAGQRDPREIVLGEGVVRVGAAKAPKFDDSALTGAATEPNPFA